MPQPLPCVSATTPSTLGKADNLASMLHGSQEFEWDEPVCHGDVIETTATCNEIYEKDGKGFYVFETVSTNQHGKQTVKGTWTNIVRGV